MKFTTRIKRSRFFKKKLPRHYEIAPDEIFLDATNVSGFDRVRFQGRLERPISREIFVGLFISLGVVALIILLQAWKLEVVHGNAYAIESAQNHIRKSVLFAPRGIIVGVNGTVLVDNRENAQGDVRREYLIPAMGSIMGYVSYPKKDSSGRYYDTSEKGIAGLEALYNTQLTGSNGTVLTEVNAVGKVYSQGTIIPAVKGKTLKLSIDASFESVLTKALSDVAKRNDFQGGAAVLMDVHTGAVRAIASYPTYNANILSSGRPVKIIAGYNTDSRHPYLDQAVQGLYAPGSIVKPFIAAGALTDGIITPNTTVDDKGFLIIKDPYNPKKIFLYKGWKALGVLAVRKAIAWSSDIFFGYVSYPKKDSSGRYYDTSEKGIAGLEALYNTQLTGSNGTVLTEVNAVGKVYSQGTIIPAVKGKTLKLSIDASFESVLTKALSDVAKRNDFQGGAAVLMDVHTGAVRAIASYPTYNANILSSGRPVKIIAGYNTDSRHPYLDQAVQGLYAPGSIVKPFIAAGALTDGIITPNTTVDDKGFLIIKDPYNPKKIFLYKGWKALGVLAVRKAIAWSSDIFFYTVGGGFGSQKGLGIKRLDYWYRQFGIGSKTGIDLPNEKNGLIPTPAWKERVLHSQWYLGDTYFTAIGQYAMQVTPIQMARAIAAVANGGKLLTPTLLANVATKFITIPVSQANFKVVREGMRESVTSALAQQIKFPYLAVAAKTGTAQVGIHNQYDNSWVEGFYPYTNPQYAFAVVLGRGPSGKGETATVVMMEFLATLHKQGILAK